MPVRKRRLLERLRAGLKARQIGNPLDGPLTRLDDRAIDAELARYELTRRDLFSADTITSCHRWRMARMIAALGVDPDGAVAGYWQELKGADAACANCPDPRRCEKWLGDAARRPGGQHGFCPNAELFARMTGERL